MSKGVNAGFAKCFIIFMAVVILVEGAGYLTLSIWGITFHNCAGENSSPVNRPFEFVLNLIYFTSKTCGAPSIYIEPVEQFVSLQIDFRIAEEISTREFIILILYAVISALWVLTSLLVLATICCRITQLVTLVCYWPWLLSILAGSILDAVATGYHIHDIVHTTSTNSTFDYVGVTQNEIVTEFLQEYDIFFVTPAVAFTCISSRVVLVWLLNIFGAVFCLSLAKVLSANAADDSSERPHRLPVDTSAPTQPHRQLGPAGSEPQMREIQRQESVVLQYQPTAPPADAGRKDRRTLEPLKSPPEEAYQPAEPTPVYPSLVVRQQSTNNNKLKTQASVTPDMPTYQSSEAHPENLDYPNRYSSLSSQPPPRSATPELSAVSPLNMRYSTSEGLPFPNQPHVSQDLRNQLPWSYTNIMNDPVAQKRIQAHLQPADDDDLPPIPVPDYTLHPPKKDRGVVSPDSQSQTGYSRW